MKFRFTQSIRWRIQAWHALILLVAIVAFCLTAYQLAWLNSTKRIDQSIMEMERKWIRSLADQGCPPQLPGNNVKDEDKKRLSFPEELLQRLKNGSAALSDPVAGEFSGTQPGYFYFLVGDEAGEILLSSANAPEDPQFLPVPATEMNESIRFRGQFRESARTSDHGLRSVVGRDISPELEEMHRFAFSLGACGFAVWFLGLLGGWWFAGKAIRPIQTISETATRIADGSLDERIRTSGSHSELDQLSQVLNHTFERLESALERQKQFTADASHELRTPLTILLSETQRMRKRKRSAEEYEESLDLCHDAGLRIRRLVEDLLLLARQDRDLAEAPVEACDFTKQVEDSIREFQIQAEAKSITIEMELQPSLCYAAPESLRVISNNLIGNAIQHHTGGGRIRVKCCDENGQICFQVSDDGIGISDEDLPFIFERFYRADQSRNSEAGHSGLGLAIVKAIVDQMGGGISVESEKGVGSFFTVKVPVQMRSS